MNIKKVYEIIERKSLQGLSAEALIEQSKTIFSVCVPLDQVAKFRHRMRWNYFALRVDFPFERATEFHNSIWPALATRDDLTEEFVIKHFDLLNSAELYQNIPLRIVNRTAGKVNWNYEFLTHERYFERDDDAYPDIAWDEEIYDALDSYTSKRDYERLNQEKKDRFSHLKN